MQKWTFMAVIRKDKMGIFLRPHKSSRYVSVLVFKGLKRYTLGLMGLAGGSEALNMAFGISQCIYWRLTLFALGWHYITWHRQWCLRARVSLSGSNDVRGVETSGLSR